MRKKPSKTSRKKAVKKVARKAAKKVAKKIQVVEFEVVEYGPSPKPRKMRVPGAAGKSSPSPSIDPLTPAPD